MGPIESHEKKVFRKNPNMGLQAILSRKLDKKLFESIYDSPFLMSNLVRIHGKIDVDDACSAKEY